MLASSSVGKPRPRFNGLSERDAQGLGPAAGSFSRGTDPDAA